MEEAGDSLAIFKVMTIKLSYYVLLTMHFLLTEVSSALIFVQCRLSVHPGKTHSVPQMAIPSKKINKMIGPRSARGWEL